MTGSSHSIVSMPKLGLPACTATILRSASGKCGERRWTEFDSSTARQWGKPTGSLVPNSASCTLLFCFITQTTGTSQVSSMRGACKQVISDMLQLDPGSMKSHHDFGLVLSRLCEDSVCGPSSMSATPLVELCGCCILRALRPSQLPCSNPQVPVSSQQHASAEFLCLADLYCIRLRPAQPKSVKTRSDFRVPVFQTPPLCLVWQCASL